MLTFLNSYLLPALSLAALPVLIHLLTRHRVKDQPFSDLRFLSEIHRRRMRRMRLRQWLLLAIRTLIVLFVVGAFTRPAIRGVRWGGLAHHERTAVAILVDNSFSTGAVCGNADVFTYEKSAARKILSLLREGDAAAVGVFNENVKWLSPKPSRFFSNLSAMLDTTNLSDMSTNVPKAINEAAGVLEAYTSLAREIYVLTDATATGWLTPTKLSIPKDIAVFVIPFSPDRRTNLTVTSVNFPAQLLLAKSPFDITVDVKNNGRKAVSGVVVSLIIDGRKASQTVVDIPAGAKKTVNLTGQVETGGFHWGYVEISADNLIADNRRYISFRIPERVRVLLCGDRAQRRYFRLALAPQGESRFFEVTTCDEQKLGQMLFDRFDVIVLFDPASMPEGTLQRLRSFVYGGGGLLIIPGERSAGRLDEYRRTLSAFGAIEVVSAVGDTQSLARLGWGKADLNHPILSVFAETGLPKASFSKVLEFHIRDGREFLHFENGMAALGEVALGDGRVVVAGFSVDARWGDLALSGFFVPMAHRVCQYLASDVAYFDTGYPVGGKAYRTLEGYSGAGKLKVSYPGGGGRYVVPRFAGGKAIAFVDFLPKAGVYAITSNGDTLDLFVANVPPREGDLTPLEESVKKKLPVRWLDPEAGIERQVLAAKYGVELWRTLLWAALVLMAAEMIIETRWKPKD